MYCVFSQNEAFLGFHNFRMWTILREVEQFQKLWSCELQIYICIAKFVLFCKYYCLKKFCLKKKGITHFETGLNHFSLSSAVMLHDLDCPFFSGEKWKRKSSYLEKTVINNDAYNYRQTGNSVLRKK